MDAKVTILNPWDSQGNQITDGNGIYPCVRGCGGGGYQQGYVLQHLERNFMDERMISVDFYNMDANEKAFMTITSGASDVHHIPCVAHSVDCRNLCLNDEKSGTLQSKNQGGHSLNYQNPVMYRKKGKMDWYCGGNGQLGGATGQTIMNTLDCMHDQQIAIGKTNNENRRYILRRLTPTECARLQGFPDWWTDGANGSDSAIYKMWGNGIALPCAADVIGRLAKELENQNT